MKIAVLHDKVKAGAAPDLQDNLVQAEQVSRLLIKLGHKTRRLAFGEDVFDQQAASRNILRRQNFDLVFNLVEAPLDQGRLIHMAPLLMDRLGVRYTGSGVKTLMSTSNKLWGKRVLRSAGLPTPDWFYPSVEDEGAAGFQPGTYIVKSVWEHGSFGLDHDSVRDCAHPDELIAQITRCSERYGDDWFAERFIPGREFNLSLLADESGLLVLPPAEILFQGFSSREPRLVDYAAKWDPNSRHFMGTPRRFDFPPADSGLLEELKNLSERCWELFGLKGWGRVDFRVDDLGRPWILEVNANPCLALDAGFMAAVKQAGLKPEQAIELIIKDAVLDYEKNSISGSVVHADVDEESRAVMA